MERSQSAVNYNSIPFIVSWALVSYSSCYKLDSLSLTSGGFRRSRTTVNYELRAYILAPTDVDIARYWRADNKPALGGSTLLRKGWQLNSFKSNLFSKYQSRFRQDFVCFILFQRTFVHLKIYSIPSSIQPLSKCRTIMQSINKTCWGANQILELQT